MESEKQVDYEKQKEYRDNVSDTGDVSEPTGLCRSSGWSNEHYRNGLLGYNLFVLCISIPIIICFFLFT